jgi:hypothetical protein
VFGSAAYAGWLKFYATVQGAFREGWIPDNYYGRVVVPRTKPDAPVSGFKTLTQRVFRSQSIPDLAYVIRGRFYDAACAPLTAHELKAALVASGAFAIYKRDGSSKGRGVVRFATGKVDLAALAAMPDGVIQRFVNPCALYRELSPWGGATLRITTVFADRPEVRSGFLRLARRDEASLFAKTAVKLIVDTDTGRTWEGAFLGDWRKSPVHPDSGVPLPAMAVPKFTESVALVLALHAGLPHYASIGWDLTVDDAGQPQILEWNGEHNGIKVTEATTGPSFADLGWEKLWRTERRRVRGTLEVGAPAAIHSPAPFPEPAAVLS